MELGRDQSGHTCITYFAKPKDRTQGDSKSYSLIKNVHVCDRCMGMYVNVYRKLRNTQTI